MKVLSIIVTLALLLTKDAVASDDGMVAGALGGTDDRHHEDERLIQYARDIRSTNVAQRSNPTCPPTSMHSEFPCEMDVDSPDMTNPPTVAPVNGRLDVPTVAPSLTPSPTATSPTFSNAPSSNKPATTPCRSTDGTFGNVDGEKLIVVPVNYMYEMETVPGTTAFEVENEILPSVEKAIIDSVLSLAFPDGCDHISSGRRRLRARRRLEVTGISMNPPDSVNPDFMCEAVAVFNPLNGCVVVDGELMLFTDNGNAEEETSLLQEFIKNEMNSGAYDSASDKIVRLRYLDVSQKPPESNLPDNGNGNENNDVPSSQNEVRVGVFVGIFAVLALITGVIYGARRRSRHADDETDLQTNNDLTSAQAQCYTAQNESLGVPTESFNVQSESYDVQSQSFNVQSESFSVQSGSFNDTSVMTSA